ncbi:chitin synthase D [Nannizzia gypsea CBS 118893]|uniref:chitin synthase n=1 Tax=Arthroderma gypseum (strain ATCC MYA-4604 / CBS 118893) TaxID=535722 RepID=E5R3H5_ARTGP|nr:chitin synthase D [Nannizzia gypsea CBS 118893]EFQ98774.1 chitin synthase D [Nannizzia gypsea CBS 118893]
MVNSDELLAEWPIKDIIYVAIIGPVMLAAFLEWFLWLAAFLYCLYKVFVKAEHISVKFLAIIMMIAFTALRGIFLPVMVVTLPLPPVITQYFPHELVSFLQWFAFWTFAVLLIVPWLFCVYRLVTNSLGRTKRIKEVLDDKTAPKTVVVMPVYKEEPEVLLKAVNSVVDCDYPPQCIHVFLSYDGDEVDESYLAVAGFLGIPSGLKKYPTSIDVSYKGARVTLSRFKHGGKRHCQKQTFRLIDKVYAKYLLQNDNLFVLFIDSDCILDRVCLQNFMYDMELKPGSKHNMLAMTGVITSTTKKTTLITLLQDMEYIHGQLFERSVESGCGAVTCLPGALTMLRFSAFRKMAKYYFADKAEQCADLFDFGKCHLGEDRWLTHLFMIGARKRYQIQMCTSAFCKTEAVQSFRSLLKQRRRWFLGFITNEVCMLTDARLWYRYPLLCIVRFMQNTIRTTALLFFIMVISVITTSNKIQNLPVGFIAVSLGLNYLLMLYFGLKLRRFKAWLYPIMFLLNPFFNWLYMVNGIFTAGQRTWGGPRADAAAVDDNTSPTQAADKAEAAGDELNVDLDTFPPTAEGKDPVPVQPPEGAEGRFTAPILGPNGCYQNTNASGLTLPTHFTNGAGLESRLSLDSTFTTGSRATSIGWPCGVEYLIDQNQDSVFMGAEDHKKIEIARRSAALGNREFSMSDSELGHFPSRPVSPARSSPSSLRRQSYEFPTTDGPLGNAPFASPERPCRARTARSSRTRRCSDGPVLETRSRDSSSLVRESLALETDDEGTSEEKRGRQRKRLSKPPPGGITKK